MNEEMKLLTVDEVAELLQVSKGSVYRWTSQDKLKHVKLGHRQLRFRPEDVQDFIQERTKGGGR